MNRRIKQNNISDRENPWTRSEVRERGRGVNVGQCQEGAFPSPSPETGNLYTGNFVPCSFCTTENRTSCVAKV